MGERNVVVVDDDDVAEEEEDVGNNDDETDHGRHCGQIPTKLIDFEYKVDEFGLCSTLEDPRNMCKG